MSEYQFYDFYAIDKALSPAQHKTVASYSSRSTTSSRRATFVYNYGDFRYEPENVLADFFDIAIYVANWGSRRLLMRFPANLVDFSALMDYQYEYAGDCYEYVRIKKKGKFVIVDLWAEQEGGYWIDGDGWLDDLLSVREQILEGDYRVLYLAWLRFATLDLLTLEEDEVYEGEEGDLIEPPVPANLGKLDTGLKNFVKFWNIDKDIIASASKTSKVKKAKDKLDLSKFIGKLSAKDKEELLHQLLIDETQAQYQLKQKLQDFLPQKKSTKKAQEGRTVAEIVAKHSNAKQSRLKKENKAADKAYKKRMEEIGIDKSVLWKEVNRNASLKTGAGYEKATDMLKDLKAYAVYVKKETAFEKKLATFLETYGGSVALRKRLTKAKVIE